MDQLSIFDLNDRLEQISKIGDPLEVLNEIVDWSKFDSILLKAKVKDLTDRKVNGNAGRKPFSLRLMLKVFILQSLYNLSDDQMEYQIKDRLSFMRFLDLCLNGTVPDAKTISEQGRVGRQRLRRQFGPVAGRLPRARLQEGLPRKTAHRVPGKVQREEVTYKMPHRACVRLGQGKPRTVRKDDRQG